MQADRTVFLHGARLEPPDHFVSRQTTLLLVDPRGAGVPANIAVQRTWLADPPLLDLQVESLRGAMADHIAGAQFEDPTPFEFTDLRRGMTFVCRHTEGQITVRQVNAVRLDGHWNTTLTLTVDDATMTEERDREYVSALRSFTPAE